MNIFDGFLDNLGQGILNPKGNFGDYQHASRTFNLNQFRLAPKVKFLYHVFFDINRDAINTLLPSWLERHTLESGLMVRQAQLPKFTVNVETLKKYNRTKQLQTSISYDPLTLTFHDDNLGMMAGLLEAYNRYYYVDAWGNEQIVANSYNKQFPTTQKISGSGAGNYYSNKMTYLELGDNTYKGAPFNKSFHGLNTNPRSPFFNNIQISLMTKKTFTRFTLVNPILENWDYGDVDYSANEPNQLNCTVKYETVWMDRGATQAGKGITGTSPKGFGDLAHYDVTPSPLSIFGGGAVSLTSTIGAVGEIVNLFKDDDGSTQGQLFDYGGTDAEFNILKAIIGGVNVIGNMGKITEAGVLEEVGGLITGGAGTFYDNQVSGVGGFGGLLE
jgi:hypothetical protein